jgi:hypothetical protein
MRGPGGAERKCESECVAPVCYQGRDIRRILFAEMGAEDGNFRCRRLGDGTRLDSPVVEVKSETEIM